MKLTNATQTKPKTEEDPNSNIVTSNIKIQKIMTQYIMTQPVFTTMAIEKKLIDLLTLKTERTKACEAT